MVGLETLIKLLERVDWVKSACYYPLLRMLLLACSVVHWMTSEYVVLDDYVLLVKCERVLLKWERLYRYAPHLGAKACED